MKVKTPVLRYDKPTNCFVDNEVEEISLCQEDSKFVLGMRKSRSYRLIIHTKKPKKKAYKFKYRGIHETFMSKDEEFEIHESTRLWLLDQLGITVNEAYRFDGHNIWVRVKEV